MVSEHTGNSLQLQRLELEPCCVRFPESDPGHLGTQSGLSEVAGCDASYIAYLCSISCRERGAFTILTW